MTTKPGQLQGSLRLSSSRMPKLRLLIAGFFLMGLFVDNQTVGVFDWNNRWFPFACLLFFYGLLTWKLAGRPDKRVGDKASFELAFLAFDVVFLAVAIYLTGGESSWLILLLPLRTADQMGRGLKRSLFFAHWTTAAYLGMLVWILLVDGRAIPWSVEIPKLGLLYLANLYLAMTSRFFDQRRQMTLEWVQLSKNLVREMQKQATDLELERINAQSASRAKSHFLANMSHELRTPMNAVMGLADLMSLHRLNKKQRQRANMLRESASDLQEVIDNLLDFSQIEADHLTLRLAECDLHEVVRGVLKRVLARADAKGLQLETRILPSLPRHLRLDPLRTRQVLLHIVDNAIKFTEYGNVAVRVRAVGESEPGTVMLRFEIEDSGIGISQKDIPSLFEPFTQVDGSLTRQQGGTGLGLPICKRLVEMMGGEIGVRSRLDRGSIFWFTLPAQVLSLDEYEGALVEETMDAEAARILVVEDNPVNQEVIVSMLTGLGFLVSKANHGAEALEVLDRNQFDLVLMDCQMPTMDGYQATEEIRRREGDGRHTPIIAVTAHAMDGDRERCLAAGMDDYLAKPLNLERLGDTLSRWIEL